LIGLIDDRRLGVDYGGRGHHDDGKEGARNEEGAREEVVVVAEGAGSPGPDKASHSAMGVQTAPSVSHARQGEGDRYAQPHERHG